VLRTICCGTIRRAVLWRTRKSRAITGCARRLFWYSRLYQYSDERIDGDIRTGRNTLAALRRPLRSPVLLRVRACTNAAVKKTALFMAQASAKTAFLL